MNIETVEMKIMEHDTELDRHDGRIVILEKSDVKKDTQINQLCVTLEKLADTIERKLDKSGDYKWIIASILMPIIFFLCTKIM